MDKQSRREAIRDYKERKVPIGIFSLRCVATGETWVGASRNLDGQKNSSFFSLRLGSHRNSAMQAAWKAHGGGLGSSSRSSSFWRTTPSGRSAATRG